MICRRTHNQSDITGFTLIELLGVLLIGGLLAGTVSLSLLGPRRMMQVDDALGQLQWLDQQARHQATRFGTPRMLMIDLDQQTVTIYNPAPAPGYYSGSPGYASEAAMRGQQSAQPGVLGSGQSGPGQPGFELPGQLVLDRLWLGGRLIDSGIVAIAIGIEGQSPSYGICLRGPNAYQRWLLVAGLSGQATTAGQDDATAITTTWAAIQRPER